MHSTESQASLHTHTYILSTNVTWCQFHSVLKPSNNLHQTTSKWMPTRKGYLEPCTSSVSSYWEISVAVHVTLDLRNNFTHFFLCFAYFSAHAHVSSCTRMRTFSHYATFFLRKNFAHAVKIYMGHLASLHQTAAGIHTHTNHT